MTEKFDHSSGDSGIGRLRAVLSRTMLLTLVWWLLTDGSAASWWIGAPAVMSAVAISIALLPPQAFSWSAMIRFMAFFIKHSLRGGTDVARRAFDPALPIDPGLVTMPLRLPTGLPRVVMAGAVNLLPGTLGTNFDQNGLCVHVLDVHADYRSELEAVERNVARIFRIELPGHRKDVMS